MISDVVLTGSKVLKDIYKLRGWESRLGQEEMVEHIDVAVGGVEPNTALVGAPTGTGKSLGLLCGIFPSGKRTIITTSTKALQNQLRNSELPMFESNIRELYNADFTWSILKGKNNYPCIHELEKMMKHNAQGPSLIENDKIKVQETLALMYDKLISAIDSGDWGNLDCEDELNSLPVDIKSKLLSEKCEKNTSGFFGRRGGIKFSLEPSYILERSIKHNCTYTYAYAHALMCDVVVMNTHLLVMEVEKYPLTTGVPFEHGLGKINDNELDFTRSQLRGTSIVAMDESHHVPNIISSCLSKKVSFGELADEFSRDIEILNKIRKDFNVGNLVDILKQCAKDIDDMGVISDMEADNRSLLSEITDDVYTAISRIIMTFENANKNSEMSNFSIAGIPMVEKWVERGSTVLAISKTVITQWSDLWIYDATIFNDIDGSKCVSTVPLMISNFGKKCAAIMNTPNVFGLVDGDAPIVEDVSDEDLTFIACSGTLPPGLPNDIGLPRPNLKYVKSPFDPNRCKIYVPSEDIVPSPPKNFKDSKLHMARGMAVLEQLKRLVRISQGRTLVLTTSLKKTDEMFDFLVKEFPELVILKQGIGSREENMKTFSDVETSVFVGTQSFWEGVDVPGPALSSVFIDKILFPGFNDPVIAARSKFVKLKGGNPFTEVSCAHAAIMMAQGVGRLIRTVTDCGLITIADPRFIDSYYSARISNLIDGKIGLTRVEMEALKWLKSCVANNPDVSKKWLELRPSKGKPKRKESIKIKWKTD